jgi:ADP-L-glycero-D-manno-heptose 6-epimerase
MIALTGGAGFIGSCFLWKLNQHGIDDVLVVDHLDSGEKWQNLVHRRFSDYLHKDDFLQRLESGALDGCIDSVVHMGACSATTETDADYLMANNVAYSRRVAEWCLRTNTKLWYASSAATYGDGAQGYSDEDEATPQLRPLNMYGYSKQLFDLWVLRRGLQDRLTGFKFFNVYGPNEYHKGGMRSLIHKAFPAARDEGVIRLFRSDRPDYADGEQQRDFIYIKDAVSVMFHFFSHPDIGGIYNVGSGRARTWNDVARAIFAALGRQGVIEYIDMPGQLKGKYQYQTRADTSKLRRAGFSDAFTPLEDCITDYAQQHLLLPDPYL